MSGMVLADADHVLVRGEKRRINRKAKYCICGRPADFVCDWKYGEKTCDWPVCAKCALEVAPDRHLCKFHQKAYEQWKRRHPEKVPQAVEQMRLGL